jgi:hypothetical protein
MTDPVTPAPAPFWWPTLQSFTAISIVLTCIALVIIRHFHPIPIEDKGLDMMVNTFFVLGLAAIVQYLFGDALRNKG